MRSIRIVGVATVLLAIRGLQATDTRVVELRLRRILSEEAIEQEFLDRVTPGSAKYMQHLTVTEVAELHRPVAGAQAAVTSFLALTTGASKQRQFATGDAVTAHVAPRSAAASRLGLMNGEAKVPVELAEYVERVVVLPEVQLKHIGAGPNAFSPSALKPRNAGMNQDPLTLQERYGVPTTTLGADRVVQGVSEFLWTGFSQAAMDTFNEYYGLAKTQVKLGGPSIFAGTSFGASEGQLDVEYIAAMAPNATTWWIGGNSTPSGNPWWSEWCDTVLGLSPLPEVISISWFVLESELLDNQSATYTWGSTPTTPPTPPSQMPPAMVIAEDGFRKLAMAGITILVASGDNGPNAWDRCGGVFGPEYPTTSQYTVSVGATYSNTSSGPEACVSWSGGGFSWWVKQPAWQKTAAVDGAVVAANHPGMAPSWKYNAQGRAYPDVAALGTNFAVMGGVLSWVTTGPWSSVSGTSASAPAFAGIISRIVAERKAKGKGSLGCISPTLYHLGKVGQDVTIGQTGNGCGMNTTSSPVGFGFPTAVGWDAATGLGTPNYTYLLSQLA